MRATFSSTFNNSQAAISHTFVNGEHSAFIIIAEDVRVRSIEPIELYRPSNYAAP